eukprot:6201827-Pleurochrysis_carterae.AAC.3
MRNREIRVRGADVESKKRKGRDSRKWRLKGHGARREEDCCLLLRCGVDGCGLGREARAPLGGGESHLRERGRGATG